MYRASGNAGRLFKLEQRAARALDADDLAEARAAMRELARRSIGATAERAEHVLRCIESFETDAPLATLVELRYGASYGIDTSHVPMAAYRLLAARLEAAGETVIAAHCYERGVRYDDAARLVEGTEFDKHLLEQPAMQALLELGDAQGLFGDDPVGRAKRALALSDARRFPEAIAEAEAALAAEPRTALAYVALAEAQGRDDPKNAEACYLKGIAAIPEDESLMLRLSHHYDYQLHDHKRSIALLERVVKLNPSESGAWGDLLFALCLAKRRPEAHRWVEQLRAHAAPGTSYREELEQFAAQIDDPADEREMEEMRRTMRELRKSQRELRSMFHDQGRNRWLFAAAVAVVIAIVAALQLWP